MAELVENVYRRKIVVIQVVVLSADTPQHQPAGENVFSASNATTTGVEYIIAEVTPVASAVKSCPALQVQTDGGGNAAGVGAAGSSLPDGVRDVSPSKEQPQTVT